MNQSVSSPVDRGPDYVVQFKIKNGPLMRAMRVRGYARVSDFCRVSKVTPVTVYNYLGLRKAPIKKDGSWSKPVVQMARFLRLPPECLFPEQHLTTALARSTGEFEMTRDDVIQLIESRVPTPDDELKQIEYRDTVGQVLQTLSPKEERILRMRFGFGNEEPMTLKEIGQELGNAPERIRQIEGKALRKLKRFKLRSFLYDEPQLKTSLDALPNAVTVPYHFDRAIPDLPISQESIVRALVDCFAALPHGGEEITEGPWRPKEDPEVQWPVPPLRENFYWKDFVYTRDYFSIDDYEYEFDGHMGDVRRYKRKPPEFGIVGRCGMEPPFRIESIHSYKEGKIVVSDERGNCGFMDFQDDADWRVIETHYGRVFHTRLEAENVLMKLRRKMR